MSGRRPKALTSRVVAALTVLLALAGVARAQMMPVRERDYWSVVMQYAHGDRKLAFASIGKWTDKELGPILKSVEGLAKEARKCQACEDRTRFETLPLPAAILLHGERDRADRLVKIQTSGGGVECAISVHNLMAEELLPSAAQQKEGVEFAARFAAAMSIHLRSTLCFLAARHWAEVGLRIHPGDARLHLADGLAGEAIGSTGFAEPVLRTTFDGRGRAISAYAEVNRKEVLKASLEAYEKALVANPRLAEARVRLGRVQWRLGRSQEARVSLKQALNESEGAALYLAHLFLGQCLEDGGDLKGAIDQYTAAVVMRPDTQIGAVALAHAHSLRGESARAREILDGVLSLSGTRRAVDPYWAYLVGPTDVAETLIEALRVESLK